MKVSIITVSYNSADTIYNTLDSVKKQSYTNIEHIIIDGKSSDSTLDIVSEFEHVSITVSESDIGIYDAMNKGIKLATGDIIGILNSDDVFHDNLVVEKIANTFLGNQVDCIFGDVQFVLQNNPLKVLRYDSSKLWNLKRFQFGFMPAHPSFYTKRENYNKFGLYKTDFKISSDFDLLLRFLLIHKLSYKYIPEPLVNMLPGGVSTQSLKMKYILNKEVIRSCHENGVPSNWFKMLYRLIVKFLFRIKR